MAYGQCPINIKKHIHEFALVECKHRESWDFVLYIPLSLMLGTVPGPWEICSKIAVA